MIIEISESEHLMEFEIIWNNKWFMSCALNGPTFTMKHLSKKRALSNRKLAVWYKVCSINMVSAHKGGSQKQGFHSIFNGAWNMCAAF